ncbi:hypothetical protein PIB30_048549 [Stylosanthes scabra]|uniref:Uncharacterized protein n=1 Tax=Stylosanthes scabra TaxID=79078 RepID=A0ABU6RHN0_9FABA|nr:hypothetical protein [Stylosanthes scabra]
MSTRRVRSKCSRATHSSSPTDSTISSATSRPKRQHDLPHGDHHFDGPRPRSLCMRANSYRLRIHGFPSRMLRSEGTKEDAAEALPPPDSSILSSEEQTTTTSPPIGCIPDVSGSTVPRASSISTPERPAEVSDDRSIILWYLIPLCICLYSIF